MVASNAAQNQEELFDVYPDPETLGFPSNPDAIQKLSAANSAGEFPIATRKQVHAEGLWHRVVGLWLYTKDGKILLQRRSKFKDTNPGKWTISVAGHVTSGQTVEEAVLSEAREELGICLDMDSLQLVSVFIHRDVGSTDVFGSYLDNEYIFDYMCMIPNDMKFSINEAEVDRVEFKDMKEVFESFRRGDPDYCPANAEVIEICEKLILKTLRI
jgi:isopentenyl-diphosphate delta-isomerase